MGYSKPTPIQAEAIPLIQTNRDLIACAQTGTGKTAAFLLPIINKIIGLPDKQRRLNTLIISPTRELATQIDNQVEGLGYFTGISSISIYGGRRSGLVATMQGFGRGCGDNHRYARAFDGDFTDGRHD